MLAFHNDPAVKEKYLARLHAHAAADEIIKGQYWQNGKGCAVGCTIHSDSHLAYEIELGIPSHLAILEDLIFESIANELAKTWPIRFLEAIEVGVNLSKVWPKIALWLLSDEKYGVVQYNNHAAILEVIDLYRQTVDGIQITSDRWDASASADAVYAASASAASASADAVYAAAASAAASADAAYAASAAAYASAYASAAAAYAASAAAAYAASAAAASAAAYAATASAYAVAYAAACADFYEALSEKMLELLKEAK